MVIRYDHSDKTYVILGCHRGGTSFVAGAIKGQGVEVAGSYPRCEDIDFINLNKKIIQEAGGIWRDPPSDEELEKVAQKYADEFKEIVKRKKSKFWGWKDPRQPLTLRGLVDYLEDDVYLICVFRKPERTARSNFEMNGVTNGEELARDYARRTIKIIERFMKL